MFYREGTFESEVQWAGFGFQVWMLMHTHFTRASGDNTLLVIDEPDVYLHPELQRKLLDRVRKKFDQSLIATHSIELINEAESNELISVDAKHKSGRRVNSELELTNLYHYIGSGSNADFARIVRAKKVIFVEGRDGKLLRKIASRFGFDGLAKSQEVPITQLGGFSEWKKAAHAVWAFKDLLKVEIKVFCVFDRDYRCEEEVRKFLKEIEDQNIFCRIWLRKEIENYIFDPEIIYNAITKTQRRGNGQVSIAAADIDDLFDQITEEMKHDVNSQLTADALRWAKKSGSREDDRTIIRKTSREFEKAWKTRPGQMNLIPGKEALSELNGALQSKVGRRSLPHRWSIRWMSRRNTMI
jgi:predicted ATP-dependent endonuclease of OLD family